MLDELKAAARRVFGAETKDERDERTQALIKRARAAFTRAQEDETEIREQAKEDLRFLSGDQWSDEDKRIRQATHRPMLTFNKLPGFVQVVSNEARQNRPQIKFTPVEENDKDGAEVNEGIARHIQYDSDADVAYETALEYAAGCSFGYWFYDTDYPDDEDGCDLELRTRTVPDPFAIYGALIPFCLGEKARDVFEVHRIPRTQFEAEYPDSDIVNLEWDFDTVRRAGDWIGDSDVRIARWWWIETEKRKVCQFEDGTTIPADKLEPHRKPKHTRVRMVDVVHTALINGHEILPDTETIWPDSVIPVITITGKQLIVDGKVKLFSVTRFARDPQQLINFAKTRLAEALAAQPVSPWIAPAGSLEGFESDWRTSSTNPKSVLYYNQRDEETGLEYQRPSRQVHEPPIASLSAFILQEIEDLKGATSIYDPSLGAESNETSGIAIRRRQAQASLANLHFMDNLGRGHKQGGRILGRVIPKIYDTDRMVRILGSDMASKVVRINAPHVVDGKQVHYKTDIKYDITVSTAPGYNTQREEAFDMLAQVLQGNPELMQVIGDLFFRNSSMPFADEIADRMKRMVNPNLLTDEKQGGADPAGMQAQLQALQAQHEELTAALNQATEELQGRKLETDSRERIEREKLELQREKMYLEARLVALKLGSSESIAQLQAEIQTAMHTHDLAHQADQADAARSHEADEAAADRMAQMQQQQTAQVSEPGQMPLAA